MSHHTAYNFTGYYQWAPTGTTDSLKKLYGQLPSATEQTLWLDKLKEIIDAFLPDIIWQDFNLGNISSANLTEFLAYYYNAALDANKEVVATAKDGMTVNQGHKGQVLDYERGGPADITTPYWLTDDAVSSSSWSYTTGMRYYANNNLIHSFVDRVSKGGNLLLNLSPMADGTFPQEQKDILAALGKFLKQMGTAIYNTRVFAVYGEGPTKMGGGGMTSPTAMTASDVRYTKSKDGDAVYALLMGWPGNGKQVDLSAVTTTRFALGSGKVFLFGPSGSGTGEIALQATQDGSGLHVTLPSTQPYTAAAYALKISKSGTPPEATPWIGSASSPDGGAGGAGGSGGTTGTTSPGGAGGNSAVGGRSGAGGAGGTTSGSGGRSGTGGSGSGGATGAGGATGTGGAIATGGTGASGGATSESNGRGGNGGTGSGGTSDNPGTGGAGGISSDPGSGGTSAAGGSGAGGRVTRNDTSASGCSCAAGGKGDSNAGQALLLLAAIASLVRRRRA
jgi:MYXO-CTERM domain-containing protein